MHLTSRKSLTDTTLALFCNVNFMKLATDNGTVATSNLINGRTQIETHTPCLITHVVEAI